MKIAKYLIFTLLIALLATSCSEDVRVSSRSTDQPTIWPDYKGVTVPPNIAPLCFSVEGLDEAALIVKGRTDSIVLTTTDGSFNIPKKQWRKLLEQEQGRDLSVTVCRRTPHGWQALEPFAISVADEEIDPYIVYRRITPGYGLWNRMGIYQRCLENYDESAIYENREGRGNCINCHSFCNGDPEKWQVHIRYRYGGTYVFEDGEQHQLNLLDKSHGNPVYPGWHPGGDMVAYSNNSTFFFIHTQKANRWEVMDDESDVFVADIHTGEQYRSPLTSSDRNYETFPSFSPDGRWLYFCSAPARNNVVAEYDSVRYNILRIPFDPDTRTFGEKVDTIYNAEADGGSASYPRISPDGRWLCFTRSPYGNFGICHLDAELRLIDLQQPMPQSGTPIGLGSFHSWSRNSRWLVCSRKVDEGIYTRLFFTHIDADGKPSKPFMLPQRDAKNYYDLLMTGYNIPELVSGKIDIDKINLVAKKSKSPQENYASPN